MPQPKKPRTPSFRVRLAQAIEAAEANASRSKIDPAASALAFLSGYLEREAPEAAAGLTRILELERASWRASIKTA